MKLLLETSVNEVNRRVGHSAIVTTITTITTDPVDLLRSEVLYFP